MDRFCLKGKTAVVTGAAGNIGRHSAMALAEAGANIAVVDLPQCLDLSEQVARSLSDKYQVKAKGYGCDLRDENAVAQMFDQIEADLGSVDVLHNNAGVGGCQVPDLEPWDSEHNMSHLEHWKEVIGMDLIGSYIVAVAAARVMKRAGHGGSIINTASMMGQGVNQCPLGKTMDDSSYGVAKAGLLYFTRHFASQVIQYGIRVNSLSPGYCYSPKLHDGLPPEVIDCFKKTQPIMRMMDVEELQGAIVFLASDASSYCVGTDLLVDGGHLLW